MNDKHFSYILGNKRKIKFCDKKNGTPYVREIAYPIELSDRELNKYVKESLATEVSKIMLYSPEDCLIAYKNQKVVNAIGFVDKYWITGDTMVIDYFIEDQKKYLEVAIDIELDKKVVFAQIKDILYFEHKCENIMFYESSNDCWMKRV